MRRLIMYGMAVASLLASLCSCDFETSGNGDLDGNWHLTAIDTLTTGGVADLKDTRCFWGVQHDLMQLNNYDSGAQLYARFEQGDGTLRVYSFYTPSREAAGDQPLADEAMLRHFGVSDFDVTYSVEQLDGARMTLSDGQLRLHFRKL